jgi:hypothetical protein
LDSDYQLPNNLILNQPLDISNTLTGDSSFQIWNYNSPLGNNLSGFKLGGNQLQINGIPQFVAPSFQVNTNASGAITSLPEVFFSYLTNSSVFRLDYATNQVLTKYNTLDDGHGNVSISGNFYGSSLAKFPSGIENGTSASGSDATASEALFQMFTTNDITGARWRISQGAYSCNFSQETTTAGTFQGILDFDTGQTAGVGANTVIRSFRSTAPLLFRNFASYNFDNIIQNANSALETTGTGSASLGSNCPATTTTAPYKWLKIQLSDGSNVFVPCWK